MNKKVSTKCLPASVCWGRCPHKQFFKAWLFTPMIFLLRKEPLPLVTLLSMCAASQVLMLKLSPAINQVSRSIMTKSALPMATVGFPMWVAQATVIMWRLGQRTVQILSVASKEKLVETLVSASLFVDSSHLPRSEKSGLLGLDRAGLSSRQRLA